MTGPVTRQDPETYLPSSDDAEELASVHDFLAAHEWTGNDAPALRYFLAGAEPGDQVEVPADVHRALRQVVDALSRGLAVTVAPRSITLTTQQAADLLGVTRPTVVKILDTGAIAFERAGTHRRVLLADVLEYRRARRAAQYDALEATSVDLDDDTDEGDLATVLADLKAARKTFAARRRAAATG